MKAQIAEFVAQHTGSTVQNGPFKGMRLALRSSWGEGDISPMLLGVYEQELHGVLTEFSGEKYGAIVNIGAADGYYAVGTARLFGRWRDPLIDIE